MRVGDVIHDTGSGKAIGIVCEIAWHGAHCRVAYTDGRFPWEHVCVESWGWVKRLTDDELAIVNAAIAAEALRRMK